MSGTLIGSTVSVDDVVRADPRNASELPPTPWSFDALLRGVPDAEGTTQTYFNDTTSVSLGVFRNQRVGYIAAAGFSGTVTFNHRSFTLSGAYNSNGGDTYRLYAGDGSLVSTSLVTGNSPVSVTIPLEKAAATFSVQWNEIRYGHWASNEMAYDVESFDASQRYNSATWVFTPTVTTGTVSLFFIVRRYDD